MRQFTFFSLFLHSVFVLPKFFFSFILSIEGISAHNYSINVALLIYRKNLSNFFLHFFPIFQIFFFYTTKKVSKFWRIATQRPKINRFFMFGILFFFRWPELDEIYRSIHLTNLSLKLKLEVSNRKKKSK